MGLGLLCISGYNIWIENEDDSKEQEVKEIAQDEDLKDKYEE